MRNMIRILGFTVVFGACATSPFDSGTITNEERTTNPTSQTADPQATSAEHCIWTCEYTCQDSGATFWRRSPLKSTACSMARTECAAACDPTSCFISNLDAECT
jgi:hypothetical protein